MGDTTTPPGTFRTAFAVMEEEGELAFPGATLADALAELFASIVEDAGSGERDVIAYGELGVVVYEGALWCDGEPLDEDEDGCHCGTNHEEHDHLLVDWLGKRRIVITPDVTWEAHEEDGARIVLGVDGQLADGGAA